MNARDRVVEMRRVRARDLVPHPLNYRRHGKLQRSAMAAVLGEIGVADALKVRRRDDGRYEIIDGHLRAETLPDQEVPVLVLDLSEDEASKLLAVFDPISAMAEHDAEQFDALMATVSFDDGTLSTLTSDLANVPPESFGRRMGNNPDGAKVVPSEPTTRRGDLWLLGRHKLLCGDCTVPAEVEALCGDGPPDLVLTDPPYCSGGFQEAGKSAGSVGTEAPHKQVANDRLSTRGYMALLKAMFALTPARHAYVFVNWRMWSHLFDVAESSGYGIRSMIVWDKSSPGKGQGWRSQHELILWASKVVPRYGVHVGNVVQCARTGNDLHTTQKPVELLRKLAEVAGFADPIYDPFGGAGSTIMAAEELGRTCLTMEVDPAYVDVAVRRWQERTGQVATLASCGSTFDRVAKQRRTEAKRAART